MKNLLICNDNASKGASAKSMETIVQTLERTGLPIEAVHTEYTGHAIELTEQAAREGAERVIIVGGDGSVNEAFNGLVNAQKAGLEAPALLIVPNGRGNDYVAGTGLPSKLEDVAAALKADHRKPVDVGYAGDGTFERYFANGSGFGFDSSVNYYATQSPLKNKLSYAYGLIKALCNDLVHQDAHFEIDGERFDEKFVIFTAMNGLMEGGGFKFGSGFDLQDGLLNLCIFGKGLPARRLLARTSDILNGRLDHPDFWTRKAAQVHIHLDSDKHGLIGQVDGETIIDNGYDFYTGISPYKVTLIA